MAWIFMSFMSHEVEAVWFSHLSITGWGLPSHRAELINNALFVCPDGGEAAQWQLYYFVPLQLSTLVQKSLTSCQVSSRILFITTLWEFVSLQIALTFHSSPSLCPVKAGLVTVPNKHEQSGRSSGLRYVWHLPATLEFLNFAPPALEEQLLGAPPPAHLAGFTPIYFDLG